MRKSPERWTAPNLLPQAGGVRRLSSSSRVRLALIAGVALPFAVAAALVPFRSSFPNAGEALVLVVAIVAVAANGHRAAGMVAAASAAIWFDFFLTRPYERFSITRRADIEITLLLLLVGAAVTELAVRGRRHRELAATDAAYLTSIGAVTDLVASNASPRVVIDQVTIRLTTLLGLNSCRFEQSAFGGLPRLESDGRLHIGQDLWDVDRYGMPKSGVELLANCNRIAYGRFLLQANPASAPPLAALQVAVILANQVGVALANEARIAR